MEITDDADADSDDDNDDDKFLNKFK